ncbi:MAG: XdhC family protein [Bacteroidota bacterium]
MLHEFKQIIQVYTEAKSKGLKSVLATVVDLDGSSYRKPGVRMLISENGTMTGAVSGGCVEKEIIRQSKTVFQKGTPKIITYDGRYRLGCDGILYILIEPFELSEEFVENYQTYIDKREIFEIISCYRKELTEDEKLGSYLKFTDKKVLSFRNNFNPKQIPKPDYKLFNNKLKPLFRLIIIGGEHDTVQLCNLAAYLGWEVAIYLSPSDPKTANDFPTADKVVHSTPEALEIKNMDDHTAVVIMTHNYAKDLKYVLSLTKCNMLYIGLLGNTKRRDKLLNEVIEKVPEIKEAFLNKIYAPAGLNLGAETPQEIAVSICSEILSVLRKQIPKSLKDKQEPIHFNLVL